MGLDDIVNDNVANSSKGGGNSKTPKSRRSTSSRWQTKVDFSTPYVVVARDFEGNIYKHKDHLAVLKESSDWRRLEDNPHKDLEILAKFKTEEGWLRFCNLCQDQLGVDPNEVLEQDPRRLVELEDKVHYPPGSKPSATRTCRVCGSTSDEDVTMLEVDLEEHRKVPVCSSHTIEDLAKAGLLQ